jgi:hypothetical protein
MMKRKRTTPTRTTTGNKLACLMLAGLIFSAAPAAAEKKPKKGSEASEPFSVIAGTVFRPPGFALPGADVEITPEANGKPKKIKTVSDARGEFALRVPPVPMKYKVDVKCNGYQPQQKTVEIEGEQHKDVTFQLEPAAK